MTSAFFPVGSVRASTIKSLPSLGFPDKVKATGALCFILTVGLAFTLSVISFAVSMLLLKSRISLYFALAPNPPPIPEPAAAPAQPASQ